MIPLSTDIEFLFSQHAIPAILHRITATFDPDTLLETVTSEAEDIFVLHLTSQVHSPQPNVPHNQSSKDVILIDSRALSSASFSPLDQFEFQDTHYRILQQQPLPETTLIQLTLQQTQPYQSSP